MELAYRSPELYDMPLFHQQMQGILGIKDADRIVKLLLERGAKPNVTETRYGEIVQSAVRGGHERTPLQQAVAELVRVLVFVAL